MKATKREECRISGLYPILLSLTPLTRRFGAGNGKFEGNINSEHLLGVDFFNSSESDSGMQARRPEIESGKLFSFRFFFLCLKCCRRRAVRLRSKGKSARVKNRVRKFQIAPDTFTCCLFSPHLLSLFHIGPQISFYSPLFFFQIVKPIFLE